MLLQVLITLSILAALQIFYLLIIKPQQRMKNYTTMFTQKGFTVLQLPFNVFRNSMVTALKKGMEHGDAQKIQKQVYGKYDVIISNVLWNSRIQFNHPTLIKSFYEVDKHYEYPKLEKVIQNLFRIAGRGLPFSEGEQWKRKRTIFNKVFNFDFVKAQTYKIAQICDQSIKELQKNRQGDKVTFNLLDLTVEMFSSVMLEIFLGGSKHEIINGKQAGHFVNQLTGDLFSQSFVPINLILGPKFLELGITKSQRQIKQKVKIYKAWGHQYIRKRIQQINNELDSGAQNKSGLDIIKSLIIDQRRNKQQNIQQETISSEQQLFEEFSSFFFAGTDTTSTFAQMMIYHIARNPEIEQKVRSEIDKYMKDDDYSYENLKNFHYIQNLQKQTSRYSGPAISLFPRLSKVDNYLNGVPIKKGTAIQIGVMANHFNEKYFKNPYEFRPERWQNQCNHLESYVFQGFSGGSRACIGKHLAMLQSKIAVIKILKRYSKIELPNPNFKMIVTFVYGPENFKSTFTISQGNKL